MGSPLDSLELNLATFSGESAAIKELAAFCSELLTVIKHLHSY